MDSAPVEIEAKFREGDENHPNENFFALDHLAEALRENTDQRTYIKAAQKVLPLLIAKARDEGFNEGYAKGFKEATLIRNENEEATRKARITAIALQETKEDEDD
jgi:hypothetical protein